MADKLRREARRAIPLSGLCREAMIAAMPPYKRPYYAFTAAQVPIDDETRRIYAR